MTEEAVNIELPKVLWGEHRTSEPFAMDIKTMLAEDSRLTGIAFIEYEEFKKSDYIERLRAMHAAHQQGMTRAQIHAQDRILEAESLDYSKRLREIHGPLVFNLHDGNKWENVDYDIEFKLPEGLENRDLLIKKMELLAQQHDLIIRMDTYDEQQDSLIKRVPPDNIVVEFMRPDPENLLDYPTQEIKSIADLHYPKQTKNDQRAHKQFMVPDRTDQVYKETVQKYSDYMADLLSGMVSNEVAVVASGEDVENKEN